MKTHKAISLIVATLVVVGGVGTAVAFYPDSESKETAEQVSSVQPQGEQAPPVKAQPVVEQQIVEPGPQVDECVTVYDQHVAAENIRYQEEVTRLNQKYESLVVSMGLNSSEAQKRGDYKAYLSQIEQRHKGALVTIEDQYGC